MAGDDGHRRDDLPAHRRARLRPVASQRARADPPRRHRGTLSRAPRGSSAASCWWRRSTARGGTLELTEQPEEGVTYADKIEPGERRLDPAAAGRELERRVRALSPHVGAYVELRDGERLGVDAPRAVGDRRPPASCVADDGACCSAAPRARSSCSRCSRRASARWHAADYLRGHRAARASMSGAADDRRPRRPRAAARTRRAARVRARAPTPTAPSAPRPSARAGPRATAHSRCGSPTAPSSGRRRSTTSSSRSPSGRVEELDPPVLAALRLGLYQLLYMDGVPDHAAVDESVELAKPATRGGARARERGPAARHARGAGRCVDGARRRRRPAGAALLHSHPRWIAELWWHELGPDEARALMARDNEPAESAVRANHAANRRGGADRASRAPRASTRAPTDRCPRRSCSARHSTCTARRCSSAGS